VHFPAERRQDMLLVRGDERSSCCWMPARWLCAVVPAARFLLFVRKPYAPRRPVKFAGCNQLVLVYRRVRCQSSDRQLTVRADDTRSSRGRCTTRCTPYCQAKVAEPWLRHGAPRPRLRYERRVATHLEQDST